MLEYLHDTFWRLAVLDFVTADPAVHL